MPINKKTTLKLQAEHGNELPISAGFFFINPFEVVYYAGGTSNKYRHFAGSYAIQWTMINYAMIMVLIDTISMVLAVILVKTLKMLESLNLKRFQCRRN